MATTARRFLWVSHIGTRGPNTWVTFPGHQQGARLEAEQPVIKLRLIFYSGAPNSNLTLCTTMLSLS